MTDQTVIKGSAPDVHVAYNASNNRQTGDTADANGNIGSGYLYDLDNRLVQPGSSSTAHYGYDVGNKRVWRGDTGVDEIAFWAGQKLATYQVSSDSSALYFTLASTNVYFGGKLISKGSYASGSWNDDVALAPVVADRLGSIKKFYPYGTERPSATSNDTEKFTGYYRDASTGLDYADQRYHQPGAGRFMTADPSGSGSNLYAYAAGDPVNNVDRNGLHAASIVLDDPSGVCEAMFSSADCGFGDDSGFEYGTGSYCDQGSTPWIFTAAECSTYSRNVYFGNICAGGGLAFLGSVSSNGPDCGGPDLLNVAVTCPPIYRAWINAHGADALATGFNEADVLALSAIESGWGGGRFATEGNSFFNLETQGSDGSHPPTKYAYQLSWMQAGDPIREGSNLYAFVASYKSASDAFKSFAVYMGASLSDVIDPATFGRIAAAHGINAGRGAGFVNTANTFMDCLKAQN